MTAPAKDRRVRPFAALMALLRLIADPQDTRQVFLMTEALQGRATERMAARFRASPEGRSVLARPLSLLDFLSRADTLACLPQGSLGRAYHEFLAEEGLSAEGLVEISRAQASFADDEASGDESRVGRRLRDLHDLCHVLTGYGRDELGEVCLLAFCFPQQRVRSFAVIATVGAVKMRRDLGVRGVFGAVLEAWRNGRAAAFLPVQPIEDLLDEDLDGLRRRWRIPPPTRYRAVLTEAARLGRYAGPLPAVQPV